MIDIINKIFEAYNEEAWSGSENDSEDMALQSTLENRIKGIYWTLEYISPSLRNPSWNPDIDEFHFFNVQYCKIFEQLEKEGLFHVYNENWTEEISLNPSVLPESKFTINVTINLSWERFIKYLYEYKGYLDASDQNAFPAGLFVSRDELVNVKSFSFPENPIESVEFYPSFNELFFGCNNLRLVHLENSTRNIKEFISTFQRCFSLESVPVLDISNANTLECMFQSCRNITSVKFKNDNLIPDNISLTRTNMFSSCEKLENVIWDINGKNDYIRPPITNGNDEYECLYMFKRCENLSSKVLNDCGGLDRTGTPMFLPTFQNKN